MDFSAASIRPLPSVFFLGDDVFEAIDKLAPLERREALAVCGCSFPMVRARYMPPDHAVFYDSGKRKFVRIILQLPECEGEQ